MAGLIDMAVEHSWMAFVGWLIGFVLSCAVGFGWASLLRAIFSAWPQLRNPTMLLPWRAAITSLVLPAYTSALIAPIAVNFGLLPITTISATAEATAILAIPFFSATFLEKWAPTPIIVRLAGGARTLAVISVALVTSTGFFSGGGLGFIAIQLSRIRDYGTAGQAWLAIMILMIVFDVVFGILQLLVQHLQRRFSTPKPILNEDAISS